ncbi:MAG: ATP-binding protein [Chthoniobacteraceae bacterium]|jgi:signal transduction histidine kinase
MNDSPSNFENQPDVPLPRLVNLVKQITHDVRNGLNAIELQSAYIAELAGNGEVAEELGKLRRMIAHVTGDMQELSGRLGELRPMLAAYPVQELVEGLKGTVAEEFETQAKRIVWEMKLEDEEIETDYTLLSQALLELLRNAIFFREGDQAIHFTAWNEKGSGVFEVRQARSRPAGDPARWGEAPLVSSRRGGYGLGLYYVRRVLEALGGRLEPGYDSGSGELSVRVTLPLTGAGRRSSKE